MMVTAQGPFEIAGFWAVLFAKKRGELGQHCAGDDLGAFGGGVNAVLLDGAGDVDEVFVDHGDEADVVFCGEAAEDLVERGDVVGSVVWGQGDASEKNLDVRGLEGGEDGVEVVARLIRREAAQAVVAAEFDDDDGGVGLDDRVDVRDSVLGGGAAGAAIFNLVFVAALVEVALEGVGPGLAGLESVACCDAVAIADDGGAVGGEQGKRSKNQAKGNEKATLYVHMISVKVCKGRNVLCAGCVRMKERGNGGLTG